MAVPVVDARALQETLGFIDEYHLADHDPALVQLCARASTPGPLQEGAWTLLNNLLTPYRAYHEEYPFLPPLPATLPATGIPLGFVHATNAPLLLSPTVLSCHLLIPGPTGSGKTTLSLEVGLTAHAAGLRVIFIDPKGDATRLAQRMGIPSLDGTTSVNLVAPIPGLSIQEHIAALTMTTTTTTYLGELGRQVVNEALHKAFQAGTPTIASIRDTVLSLRTPKDTYARRDAINGVAYRYQRIIETLPVPSTSQDAPGMASLLGGSLHVSSVTHDTTTDWLVHHLLQTLYLTKRASQDRTLSHVVLIDEGLLTVHKDAQTITGQSILARLYGMVREFGISLIITTLSLAQTDPHLRSNAGTLVILRPHEPLDLRAASDALHLNPSQVEFIRTMPKGLCVVRHPDLPDPILVAYPPLPLDKTIPPEQRQTPTATARPQLTAGTNAVSPNSTPDEHRTTHDVPRPIALNGNEGALLDVVCDAVTPSTPAYRKAGLSLADGDQAAKRLQQKGLIERERIVIRSGRGGTAIGLRATATGYTRAGKERVVRHRGGTGIQSAYLIESLHRLLKGMSPEAMVGKKSADLLLVLNTARDQSLLAFLRPMLPSNTVLSDGALIAIEVEASDPAKTAPSNAAKDHEAGIAVTVIAVLPKALAITKRALATLPPNVLEHTILVNVLHLLQHLEG